MSDYRSQARPVPSSQADMAVDAGLRSFMLGVYNKMGLGLLLSGVLAWVVGTTPVLFNTLLTPPIAYAVMFGPLAILLITAFTMKNPSPIGANIVYWSVVTLIGIGLGGIVFAYGRIPDGMTTVAKAFLITSATFGALSLWGYTTKRDLTGMGTFLFMAVIGLIIASVVNMFMQSSMMSYIISVAGVVIFAGLTAYDTQRLKFMYYELQGNSRGMAVPATQGALALYLDFINLFTFLLHFMGNRE